jgi:YebC/PmpR family DNA-binding regulatory protein
MSGHSKWDTIKRKKGANDAKRAKEFTKIARLIAVAAQNGGGDPNMNPALALVMDKARAANMPNDNVDRAIKRGTGEGGAGGRIEEISYEGYGPLGIAMIVDCATDNRNRTVADLRSTVEKTGGTFAETGAVSWQFKTLGRILLEFETDEEKKIRENAKWNDKVGTPKLPKADIENFELELYDLNGILDISSDDFGMEIKTEYSELNNVKKFIESKNIKISDAELVKESENQVELDEEGHERVEKFIEAIEDMDDVQKVWTNVKLH